MEERPAKRRKTGGPTPVEQDSQPAGSDGIDELGLQQEIIPSVIRDSQRTSQTNSFLSQENERPKAYFGTEEFRNVENTMNSNPNRKSKGKRRNHSSPTGAVSGNDRTRLLESKATSAASPINLSDDEEVRTLPSVTTHQIKYQGTANGAHKNFLAEKKSMPSLPVQDTGRTSRHFIQSADAITKHSSAVIDSLDSQSQRDVEMEADRLDNKFRAANGKARSQDFASSPDVLSGDTTVGAVLRQDSPTKSSSSTRKGSPVKESQPPLPPSNISGSAFVGAIRQSKGTASTRRDQSAQESDAPWGIRLAAVSVQDCMYRSTTLGLQHRADLEAYDVIDGGKNWADQSLSFRVLLAKLRKVTWSKTGRMVRFESAKSEGADNVLDIELCNEKDLTTLAKKIQEKYHPFKIIGEEE